MKKDKFNEFEKEVMKMLLAGDNKILKLLQEQYNSVKVQDREFTESGFFTTFIVRNKGAIIPYSKSFNFGDVGGAIDNVNNGVGFVLFVKDGFLSMLEGYTYEENWPKKITNYKLYYFSGIKRDLDKLKKKWE